jgi:hypothetical protein
VGYLRIVKNDAILEFAGISKHDAVADDDVFTDIAATSYLAVAPDPGRPFDGGAVLDDRTFADIDMLADKRPAHNSGINGGFQAELKIAPDLFEDIPDLRAVIEDSSMLCLVEIEKIRRRKHRRRGRFKFVLGG